VNERKKVVLVTGANGFVGHRVVDRLSELNTYDVHALDRHITKTFPPQVKLFPNCDITKGVWNGAFENAEFVIHCAARVHIMKESFSDSLAEFRRLNVDGTMRLARKASKNGVKRLIFISSIGVNGAQTLEKPFTVDDEPAPHSPYAQSKYEAEVALRKLSKDTGMGGVVLRPPLVYGPEAPGNFRTLLKILKLRLPLPLGSVHNKRSFIALDNLVDLIVQCIAHPAAANRIFLVSDDEDLSTTDLLRRMSIIMGINAILIPVPTSILNAVACLMGKASTAQQLLGSLQIDIKKTKRILNWKPPINVNEALKRTVNCK
jgi:nucleoside-diphosphate-sugar epimerase